MGQGKAHRRAHLRLRRHGLHVNDSIAHGLNRKCKSDGVFVEELAGNPTPALYYLPDGTCGIRPILGKCVGVQEVGLPQSKGGTAHLFMEA